MLKLKNIELIINFITFFLVYVLLVTLIGAFRAWVAKKMGDDTPEEAGYLTLNPLVHVDPLGFIFLFLFYFVWGTYIPINQAHIVGKFRVLKILVAYFADSVACFAIALVSLISLIGLFDAGMLFLMRHMILTGNISHLYLLYAYPHTSSLIISGAFVLVVLTYLSVVLGVVNILMNGLNISLHFLMQRFAAYDKYNYYLIVLSLILCIYLFSEPLYHLVTDVISYMGYMVARTLWLI